MVSINRDNVPAVVLVLIALLAIATTAATITDVNSVEGTAGGVNVDFGGGGLEDGGSDGEKPDVGSGSDGEGGVSDSNAVSLRFCIDILTTAPGILALVLANLGILAALRWRYNTAVMLFAGFAIVPLVFGLWVLLTNCTSGSVGGSGATGGSSFLNQPGVVTSAPVDPGLLGIAFGAIVVIALAVMVTMTMRGSEETFEPPEEDETPDADEAAFARAAGRAADRIEETNVSVDNAVYEAWAEMTDLLDIPSPETSAPMDFADIAIETGLEAADVYRLTELFNEVRYGHRDAAEREEQALETLRHIESAYEASGDEPATDNGGDR